jgi:hypothetical protein
MPRDDELYALVQEDQRIFFPGGHPGKATAIQALLNPGYHAKWHDRSGGKRFGGFVTVHHTAEDWWHLERVPAAAWQVSSGAAAWASLVKSVEPEILGDVDARLAERPASLEDAISLASAPDTMMRAEELVREAFRRSPLGAATCPQICWRAMSIEACARSSPDRTAFDGLAAVYREALGGRHMDYKHKGRAAFEFSRYSDVPPLLKFAAEDYGEALTFDELRSRGFVSSTGVAFAALENPFESLLRIARAGIVVQEVSPRRVVLGATD